MKQKSLVVILSILIAIMMLLSVFTPKIISVNAQEFCSAKSMCVIEQTSKRVLMEKSMDIQLPMASTTKVMTALVALENCDNLDESFNVDNRAVGIEGTSIYLRKNEQLSMRELLYGLMLNSGNDAAMAIAYKIGDGDVQKFVDLMNNKAEQLDLQNTHFDNPHGLDSSTHYTSAHDLAIITACAMENADFREIVKTEVKEISAPQEMGHRFVRNKHKLLRTMEGCDGVKTGFTDNARRCCVTSCVRNGMRLICVVLNCNDMFEESQKCLEKCFNEYKLTPILEPYKYIGKITATNSTKDQIELFIKNGFSYPLKENEIDEVKVDIHYDEVVEAPKPKEYEVGEVKVTMKNNLIYSEKICTIEEIKEKNLGDKVRDIIDNWY